MSSKAAIAAAKRRGALRRGPQSSLQASQQQVQQVQQAQQQQRTPQVSQGGPVQQPVTSSIPNGKFNINQFMI